MSKPLFLFPLIEIKRADSWEDLSSFAPVYNDLEGFARFRQPPATGSQASLQARRRLIPLKYPSPRPMKSAGLHLWMKVQKSLISPPTISDMRTRTDILEPDLGKIPHACSSIAGCGPRGSTHAHRAAEASQDILRTFDFNQPIDTIKASDTPIEKPQTRVRNPRSQP